MTFVGAVAAVEVEVVDALDALHIHRQALEPVGELAGDRRAFEARDLLEVGELRHFHAVAPAFPAEAPGAERRALPVVLDEADVVQLRIDADGVERLEIELLDVRRRRLQDHLELVIVLQPVRVLAVAAVLRPARGLHVGRVPRLRPERAQRRRRMERAGADFHVVGLQDDAALLRPEVLQRQDQALERARRIEIAATRRGSGEKVGFSHRFRCLALVGKVADPIDGGLGGSSKWLVTPRGGRREARASKGLSLARPSNARLSARTYRTWTLTA